MAYYTVPTFFAAYLDLRRKAVSMQPIGLGNVDTGPFLTSWAHHRRNPPSNDISVCAGLQGVEPDILDIYKIFELGSLFLITPAEEREVIVAQCDEMDSQLGEVARCDLERIEILFGIMDYHLPGTEPKPKNTERPNPITDKLAKVFTPAVMEKISHEGDVAMKRRAFKEPADIRQIKIMFQEKRRDVVRAINVLQNGLRSRPVLPVVNLLAKKPSVHGPRFGRT